MQQLPFHGKVSDMITDFVAANVKSCYSMTVRQLTERGSVVGYMVMIYLDSRDDSVMYFIDNDHNHYLYEIMVRGRIIYYDKEIHTLYPAVRGKPHWESK